MNRRKFLASVTGGVAGVCCFGSSPAVAFDETHRIRKTDGWTIDERFGATERAILTTALGNFYARFLQPYRPVRNGQILEWNYAGSWVTGTHVGHYEEGTKPADIFYADWLDMWRHFVDSGKAFPPVTLRFVSEENAGFVAQADYDTILIRSWPNDNPYRGKFIIDINDWYLANGDYAYGSDPKYWGGVIAHEAWHNLGHRHPKHRSDEGYYQYQMILHEMCVMQDSNIRYGAQLATPVYCRRPPS
jgi:hypothetical protein